MTRAPKKSPAPKPEAEAPEDGQKAAAPPAKAKVQFGPTPSAPGSRLKKGKGS